MSAGTSEFKLIQNEVNPSVKSMNVTGLTSGQIYQFRVSAINFNGESQMSEPLVKYSCLLPSAPAPITRVSGTRTSLSVQWQAPHSDGGCPITGYNLYRDDGGSGSIAIEVDPAVVSGKPSYLKH